MEEDEPIPTVLIHKSKDQKDVHYRRCEEIGHGGFAKVFRGLADGDKEVAIKVTSKKRLTKSNAQQKHRCEVEIQLSLHNPRVLKALDFFEDEQFTYLVLEMCSLGSLKNQLRKRMKFTEDETIRYLRDIVGAVAYLHDNRILHRDLKLENFLMDADGAVKVGDFGLSAKLDHDDERRYTVCGTPNYMCPEMLSGAKGVSYEVDLWAIGVSTFGMLTGHMPFQQADKKGTYALIRKAEYKFPDTVALSLPAKQFIAALLQIDPEKRPSAHDLMQHQFIVDQAVVYRPPLKERKNAPVAKPGLSPVPDFFVSRFCDHSEKYGLGYLLVNGTVGACFNDSSRIAMDPSEAFIHYWDSYGVAQPEVLTKESNSQKKKITILLRFLESLKKSPSMFQSPRTDMEAKVPLTHVKYWLRTEQATLFRMDNRNIQVNFTDRTKLFIFWNQKELMIAPSVFDQGKRIPLSDVSGQTESEEKSRFLIAKEMLAIMSGA
jgi:polo-like kinase 1